MGDHVDEWFADWIKGELSEDKERELREHVESCDRCAEEFRRVREDFAVMASRRGRPGDFTEDSVAGENAAVSPSADLRDRVLGDLRPEARFLDLLDEVAEILDLPVDEARRLLGSIDDESNWVPFPGHDIAFFYLPFADIEPGDEVDARFTSILRVKSGASFPEHRHVGHEEVFVLQGEMLDEGERYERGELVAHEHETAHTFSVPEDSPDLIGIVLVEEGLVIGGIPFGGPGE